MTAQKVIVPPPRLKFFDEDGNPLTGGKVFTYLPGSTTKMTTYTDASGLTPNTNPIILDADGECDMWVNPLTPEDVDAFPPGPPGPAGPQGVPGPPGPTGNFSESVYITDFTSANVYGDLAAQYYEIAPAGGFGIANIPTGVTYDYLYRAAPFVVSGNFELYWGPAATPTLIPNSALSGAFMNSTDSTVNPLDMAGALSTESIITTDAHNQPILLYFDGTIAGAPIITIAINAGGTGYAVNDTGTIATGTGGTYIVTSVSTGVVTGITLTVAGTGYTSAEGVATATGGAQPGIGTGLLLNIYTASQTGIGSLLRCTINYRRLIVQL